MNISVFGVFKFGKSRVQKKQLFPYLMTYTDPSFLKSTN